jgi:hypothetical protein
MWYKFMILITGIESPRFNSGNKTNRDAMYVRLALLPAHKNHLARLLIFDAFTRVCTFKLSIWYLACSKDI